MFLVLQLTNDGQLIPAPKAYNVQPDLMANY